MLKNIGIAALVLAAGAALAGETDWNQWRGPNRNGIAPDSPKLADEWGKDGPVQLWKSEEKIPGGFKTAFSNFGSPVVAKGRVYLYVHWPDYEGQTNGADVIVCLDANTGKTLWKTSYPGLPKGLCSSTPYVGDGKVYTLGTSGMYCLDAETGKEVWKVPSPGLPGDNGLNSSPALVDGVLVVNGGSGKHLNPNVKDPGKESSCFKGFDPATGKELWSCPQATADANLNGDTSASAAVWNTDKGPRLITSTGKLTCVNPKDGSVIWEDSNGISGITGTPAVRGDVCVIGQMMKGYRLGPDKAETLFAVDVGDRCGSYLLYDGHVYADCSGTYRCFDLTGKILWQKSKGGNISSPVLADGKIFHNVNGSKVAMFSATPTMPETFFEFSVRAQKLTSPAICGGRMYLRLEDGVACYDLTKAPATVAITSKGPVTAATRKSDALISFVDVSPSYFAQRKGIKDQVWPPEKEAEAAALDWAVNKPLDADGWVDFTEVQDARCMRTDNAVVYARVVLDAQAPGKLALSLSVIPPGGDVRGIWAWVNGANVLRTEVAHPEGPVKTHQELVVDLVAGKNTLLFRTNTSGPRDWKLQVQAKDLDGLEVKQVASTSAGNK